MCSNHEGGTQQHLGGSLKKDYIVPDAPRIVRMNTTVCRFSFPRHSPPSVSKIQWYEVKVYTRQTMLNGLHAANNFTT
jgi:hypothetical protein